jgi:hypothetical protein
MDLNHYGPGRPPSPETMALLNKMVSGIREEPGIKSAKLARRVGIPSLQCAIYAKRLAKRGFIVIGRQNRALTYTLA